MKKTFIGIFILSVMILAFSSCQKVTSAFHSSTSSIQLDNGRLHFSNKALLKKEITEFKKGGIEFAANKLKKYYNKDFYSLRPIINKKDESLMYKYEKRKMALKSAENNLIPDDLENEIGDDNFASLINDKGEIEVGDTIYAYTPKGLFYAKISDSSYLHDYLNQKVNKSTQLKQSNYVTPCEYALANEGIHQVNPKIMRFIQPVPAGGCGGGSGVSNGNNIGTNDMKTFESFINSLSECSYHPGTLDFLFGPSAICTSYFDRRHRVKTKFWNQHYLIYKSIGISVKHQTRRVLIWWNAKTDEIALGVKQAYFEYNMPLPQQPKIRSQLYVFDGKVYSSVGQYLATLSGNNVINLPFSSSLEVVVNLPFYGIYENDISSQSLNKFFWKFIWNQVKGFFQKLGKEPPSEVSLVGLNAHKIIVDYVNTSKEESNSKKVMKIFDWQARFGIVLGDNTGKIHVERISLPNFYSYKNIKIDIYGAARQGSVWKGSHLVYSEN